MEGKTLQLLITWQPTPIAIEEELRRQFSINPRLIAFLLPLRALVFFERGSSPSLRILLSRLFRRQSVQAPRFPSSHSVWVTSSFSLLTLLSRRPCNRPGGSFKFAAALDFYAVFWNLLSIDFSLLNLTNFIEFLCSSFAFSLCFSVSYRFEILRSWD